MLHRPLLASALMLGLLFCGSPSLAEADARVAVLPFRGPGAEAAREAAASALRDRSGVRVAPLGRTDRAVGSARGARAARRAADRLGADYVVSGRVRRRGSRARVRLTLADSEGEVLAQRTVRVRRGDFDGARFDRAARAFAGELDDGVDDYEEEEAEPRRRTRRDRSERRERRERDRSERRRDRDDDRSSDDGRSAPMVDARVGARLSGRLARFTTATDDVHRNDVAYPLLTASLAARPWVAEEGLERGIEMRGFFGHAVGLRMRNQLTDEPVDTSFFQVYADVGVLFEVDPSAELGLGLGFGWDSYAFGEQSLVIVPSAEYAYLRPHLRGRFRLEDELLVLGIDMGYRGVLSRGALSEHFGQDGQTQGFDLGLRLGGSLDLGDGVALAYGLETGLAAYFHFFDGDAITAPAKDGTDISLWLGAQAGLAFR